METCRRKISCMKGSVLARIHSLSHTVLFPLATSAFRPPPSRLLPHPAPTSLPLPHPKCKNLPPVCVMAPALRGVFLLPSFLPPALPPPRPSILNQWSVYRSICGSHMSCHWSQRRGFLISSIGCLAQRWRSQDTELGNIMTL